MKMEFTPPAPGVDVNAPLIYMWEIHDGAGQLLGRYVGKANGGARRPTQHYPRNVNKLLQQRPYKKGKQYRRVHVALANAVRAGHPISLTYLCNVASIDDIFAVEARYIEAFKCHADDGIGLNGTWKGPSREAALAPFALLAHAAPEDIPEPVDLDDFLAYFDACPPGTFIIRVSGKSCSVYSQDQRVLRAKQAKPGATVFIKLAQSSSPGHQVQFAWDGSDSQIETALATERNVLLARGALPGF